MAKLRSMNHVLLLHRTYKDLAVTNTSILDDDAALESCSRKGSPLTSPIVVQLPVTCRSASDAGCCGWWAVWRLCSIRLTIDDDGSAALAVSSRHWIPSATMTPDLSHESTLTHLHAVQGRQSEKNSWGPKGSEGETHIQVEGRVLLEGESSQKAVIGFWPIIRQSLD